MITADVYLWGTKIGIVYQQDIKSVPVFCYEPSFQNSNIQVAPLMMPLSSRQYSFPLLEEATFHGLAGLLSDSLPDKFGTKLIERYLAESGRDLNSFSAVERLLYVGNRGMGALEFAPPSNYAKDYNDTIDISRLVDISSKVLSDREQLLVSEDEKAMEQLINVGTSAGGARAKAVVAWNRKTKEFRSGQITTDKDFEYWLIKFDGVSNNKDKDKKADGKMYTRIEYAYYLMAKNAGITMNECQLYKEDNCYHFMTKRFDRTQEGQKLHMQSLGAMAHFDYNVPQAYSYEQAYDVMLRIGLGNAEAEQLFKRMLFNVMARNQDDHVKNISFLMNKAGEWSLAPAYDITYANNPTNRWTSSHQMTINGKASEIGKEDIFKCGRRMNLSRASILNSIEEIQVSLCTWEKCAQEANIREEGASFIKSNFEAVI